MPETGNISHWKDIFVDVPHTSPSLYTWLDYQSLPLYAQVC
jgi:hypothetical protein